MIAVGAIIDVDWHTRALVEGRQELSIWVKASSRMFVVQRVTANGLQH